MRKIVLLFLAILVSGSLFAQNKQITGLVTDQDGAPVIGATVVVNETSTGAVTGGDGYYSVSAPADATLTVTFIGYTDAVVGIEGRDRVDVQLTEDAERIDDVIVIAFGQAKREAFTGSVKVIDSDVIAQTKSSNVEDALIGRIAGVQFAAPSGRLGAGQNIVVRGQGSFSADVGKDPLWVIDGVPYEGDINNINQNDMESVTVLKDAASNALYGARGANGVIMVTTKRAKTGEAKVTFDGSWGVNTRALQTYDIAETAGEFYELHYKALYNYYNLNQQMTPNQSWAQANGTMLGTTPGNVGYNVYTIPNGQTLIGSNGRINPNATVGRISNYEGEDYLLQPDNWLDAVYRSATLRQEYNVSVSGSTDKANIYASMGYLDNEGIIAGSNMNRLTARLRADYQAKKWLKMGATMTYSHFEWNNGNDPDDEGAQDGGNVFQAALRMAPIYPIYIRDGNGVIKTDQWGMQMYDTGSGGNGGALRSNGGDSNPLQDIQINKNTSEGNAFSANGFLDFNLLDGLTFTVNGNVYIDETRSTKMYNPYYGQFAASGGAIDKSHLRDMTFNTQQLLHYTKDFGRHSLDLLAGHEVYDRKLYSLYASKSVMWSPDNLELDGSVVDGQNASSSVAHYNNEGYFFRAMYDLDDRYYLSGSYRRDASSKFHPDNRWGNFWSLGASWIISKENWFSASWVDMLKLKASYGEQGLDQIPDYLYTDMYSIENDGADNPVSVFTRKGNKDITWQTDSNLNVGVEFSLFGDRLSGGVDVFNRLSSDQLFNIAVPSESGYSSMWVNVGDVLNRGVEAELNAVLVKTTDLVWDFSINMSHIQNKFVRLPDAYKNNETSDGKVTGRVSGNSFLAEGYNMFSFYIPTTAGLNEEGKQLWYYWETAADGTKTRKTTDDSSLATSSGRELQGDPNPDLFGGFSTSLRWKGLDFTAAFTYQLGGLVIDSGYQFYMANPTGTSTGDNYHRDQRNSWTPENTDTTIPRFAYNDAGATTMSDRFLTDASFLNIQNLTLGYTLPNKFTSRFEVQNLRVYVNCSNVWYWSKRQGLDPRQGINGATNAFYYAPIRTISGGVSLTF
ncbi:MAG: SusC/RagA family TonB-linked outer membrane protein [Alistipes sp.]|jgi:TonB-linked SusC/RagA family outer membrane protein|nr:SusC/RagA family TonB-linked outer membrane protein [Alistipes sp.]